MPGDHGRAPEPPKHRRGRRAVRPAGQTQISRDFSSFVTLLWNEMATFGLVLFTLAWGSFAGNNAGIASRRRVNDPLGQVDPHHRKGEREPGTSGKIDLTERKRGARLLRTLGVIFSTSW